MIIGKLFAFVASGIRSVVPARFRPYVFLEERVREACGQRVRSGPFMGMHYVREAVGSMYLPKLLGTYERELHGIIEELVARKPRLIIDAGAAEGYYAIGLALRLPSVQVVAYEAGLKGRVLLAEMAAFNAVESRVTIRGFCHSDDLRDCGESSAIICDCEGYEADLFTDDTVARLKHACVLIESHDVACPGVTRMLKSRFAKSHHCSEIVADERTIAEFPFRNLVFRVLPRRYRKWAVSEDRKDGRTWLWFTPHAESGGATC